MKFISGNSFACAFVFLTVVVSVLGQTSVKLHEALNSGSWCAGCDISLAQSSVAALVSRLNSSSAQASRCGDGICDINQLETCRSCEADCGVCTYTSPILTCKNSSQALLSIDDGPSAITRSMIDILRKNNVPFISFLIGVNLINSVYPDGDSVYKKDSSIPFGTHTYSHTSLSSANVNASAPELYVPEVILSQLLTAEEVFAQHLHGRRPRLLRPPYLEVSADSLAMMEALDFLPVSSSVDSHDWTLSQSPSNSTAQKIILDNVINGSNQLRSKAGANNGGPIILIHEIEITNLIIEKMIVGMRENGFEFVDAQTCLGISKDELYRQKPLDIHRNIKNIIKNLANSSKNTTSANENNSNTNSKGQTGAEGKSNLQQDGTNKDQNVSGNVSAAMSRASGRLNGFTSFNAFAILLLFGGFFF